MTSHQYTTGQETEIPLITPEILAQVEPKTEAEFKTKESSSTHHSNPKSGALATLTTIECEFDIATEKKNVNNGIYPEPGPDATDAKREKYKKRQEALAWVKVYESNQPRINGQEPKLLSVEDEYFKRLLKDFRQKKEAATRTGNILGAEIFLGDNEKKRNRNESRKRDLFVKIGKKLALVN